MLDPPLDAVLVGCQFRRLQGLVKMHIEEDPLLLQHMGQQHLCIQPGRIQPSLGKILLRPFQDFTDSPHFPWLYRGFFIFFSHYCTCFNLSA